MPRLNGTGPWGLGPNTGWGLGSCGAGLVWRRGQRRFVGPGIWQRRLTKKEELDYLQEEKERLKEELEAVEQEIKNFKAEK